MNAHQRRVARRARKWGTRMPVVIYGFHRPGLAEPGRTLNLALRDRLIGAGHGDHARDYDSGGYYG